MEKLFGMKNLWVSVVILCLIVAGLAILIETKGSPNAVEFTTINLPTVLKVFGGLFMVALMIERALEVIVSVLRDADAELLKLSVTAGATALQNAEKTTPPNQSNIDKLQTHLTEAQKKLTAYRVDTKETSYCISFVLGTLVSLVGVRGLNALLQNAPTSGLFTLVDVVVTGAVLAGGSDGIHQMISAAVDFFNMLSKQSNSKSGSI